MSTVRMVRTGPAGRRTRVAVGLVAVAVLVGALTAGCAGKPIAGTPRALGEFDTKTVGGKPVTNGPTGPRQGVPDADLKAENGDRSEMDRLAINAVSDIYDYWSAELPANFDGAKFQPLKRLISYDSGGTAVKICGQSTAGLVNAFYCGQDDSISWDRGVLLPLLNQQFGTMSVVTVLAHELGHAIQFRLGEKSNIDQATPTIVKEQQADCYAGTFFRWVADGNAKHFTINTGQGLNKVLATMFFIRDPAGVAASTRGAHGLAFDRVFAFQEGYTKGPRRCAEMSAAEITKRIQEKQRSENDELVQGQVDIAASEYFTKFQEGLNEAFKDNGGAAAPQIKDNGAKCRSGKSTSPAAFCPDENLVAIDLGKLKKIATPPKRSAQPGSDSGIGDFAAFAEIASRYALAIEKGVGAPLEGEAAGLRTACLTGAWAGYTDKPSSRPKLRLAVGDLDEAVAELLQDNSLIAADVNGTKTEVGFTRVEAFRIGYFDGSAKCSTQFT